MAATLQRKCCGVIIYVISTKIITKIIVPRNYFVIVMARMVHLVDVSDIFYFFLVGEGEGGVRGARKGGGLFFLLEFPGGAGFSRRRRCREAGSVSAANWGIWGGG